MAVNTTPRRGSSTAASQMQLVLRSASLHPPPTTSLDAAASSSSGASASVVASELMAVSASLDLAILCKSNTIRAVSLMDVPHAAAHAPGSSSIRTPLSAQQRRADDPFHAVSFSADCAPRPGDDIIPSDSIPPKTPIKGLQFSPSGHSLLIWGESYVAVARLPRGARTTGGSSNPTHGATPATPPTPFLSPPRDLTASGRRRGMGGGDGGSSGDKSARWKWTLVDMSGYAVDVMRQRIVHAAWHPASDGCVTLLTAGKDDVYVAVAGVGAKAFVMLHVPGRERPEQVRVLWIHRQSSAGSILFGTYLRRFESFRKSSTAAHSPRQSSDHFTYIVREGLVEPCSSWSLPT